MSFATKPFWYVMLLAVRQFIAILAASLKGKRLNFDILDSDVIRRFVMPVPVRRAIWTG